MTLEEEIIQVLERIETLLQPRQEERKNRYLYVLEGDESSAETILDNLNIQYRQGTAPLNSIGVLEYILECSEDQFTVLMAELIRDLPQAFASRDRPLLVSDASTEAAALRNRLRIVDYEDRLVSGDLTSDGIQYSSEVDTGAIDTDVEVLNVTIDPEVDGTLIWVELGLTAEFKAITSITADLIWKWQARNVGESSWVDLHSAVTEADIGTTYVSRTRQGFFNPQTGFNSVPFEIRLILQCNEANEGRAKVKSSSYVRAVYKAD